jgi:hypothetical protein
MNVVLPNHIIVVTKILFFQRITNIKEHKFDRPLDELINKHSAQCKHKQDKAPRQQHEDTESQYQTV